MLDERTTGGNIATLLVEGRKGAGISQSDLAERAGVSRSAIIAAESRSSLPTMDLCVRLSRALKIPLPDMVRAHVHDGLRLADPSALAEVEGQLGGVRSHWEEIAEHHGLWIDRGLTVGRVSAEGHLELRRRYSGCRATRSRDRIVFRDRVFGEKPPAFAVKGSPRGVGYSMNVSIEGEWAEHRVEFHRPWTPQDLPFDFEFETQIPHAFVLDVDECNRRREAEGLRQQRTWTGDFRTSVTYPFETLELKVLLPDGYQPQWCPPTATWGNAPIEDADYHELHRRTCGSFAFEPRSNAAKLVLRRPAPGYTFGIQWTPLDGWTVAGKGGAK